MMLTPPAIPGFDYERTTYADLVVRLLAIDGWTSELLGESAGGRDIYGFSYGDMNKPTMWVHGNIHGWHEWRTCWWVSEFMKLIHDPSALPAATRDAILDLRDRYSFYFIPALNPDGYGEYSTNWPYRNGNGVSISANFDFMWTGGASNPSDDTYRGPSPFSEPEAQIVRNKFLALTPVSMLCNHTWSSTNVGYMMRHPQNAYDDPPITAMWSAINATLGYGPEYTKRYEAKLASGSAYNWAGTLQSPAGRTVVAQVWESGGGMSVEDQSRVGMTGILYHMLMVDSLMPEPQPKMTGEVESWGPLRIGGTSQTVTAVDMSIGGNLHPVWRP